MTVQPISPIPLPTPESKKTPGKQKKFIRIEAHTALKKKLRKSEREVNQIKKREKTLQSKLDRTQASETKSKTKLDNIRKENIHLTDKLLKQKNEISKASKELQHYKKQYETLKKSQDKTEYYRHLWEEEKQKHERTLLQLSRSNQQGDESLVSFLQRMDEFIDGGIKERGDLIRQLDRVRDRAVQSIRILEQEKAINLGLLKNNQVNRKIAERTAVFIDVQNMFYAARQQFSGRLDFQRLLKKVSHERRLLKAIAYIVETPDIDQTNFITLLTRSGYEVKSKELRTRGDGSAKGNWDMEMAMDIISLLPKLDVVVLVSGDGDFVPLVEKMKDESKVKCEIYGFEHNTAIDLKEIADTFFPITKDLLLDSNSEVS